MAAELRAVPSNTRFAAIIPFLESHSRSLALALVLIATIRIVSTYSDFNCTSDEPAHVACGVEWLSKGIYTWEPQHPPLPGWPRHWDRT